jgi:hypothetical protein
MEQRAALLPKCNAPGGEFHRALENNFSNISEGMSLYVKCRDWRAASP